jgi:hypothetical protein
MSWQFRKSKGIGPMRFTLSKRGLGTSIGAGPVRVGRGADGQYRRSVRIPKTGLSNTKQVGGKRPAQGAERVGQQVGQQVSDRALLITLGVIFGLSLFGGLCSACQRDDSAPPKPYSSTAEMRASISATPSTATTTPTYSWEKPVAAPPPSTTTVAPAPVTAAPPTFTAPPLTDEDEYADDEYAYPEYATCAEAAEDGVFNIYEDEPNYWAGGDTDGDGVACEDN